MRERFFQTKLTGFQPHEVIELILYGAIPLRDVNPLAHALIDAFGSVDAVLSAPKEALMAIPGIGERTADLIACVNDLCRVYEQERFAARKSVGKMSEVLADLRPLLHTNGGRELGVLCLDGAGSVLATRVIPWRQQDPAGIRSAVSMALELNAHSVILVLSRPVATRRPGKVELEELSGLISTLSGVEVYTVDALVLYGSHTLSLRKEGILSDETRSFLDDDRSFWTEWFNLPE